MTTAKSLASFTLANLVRAVAGDESLRADMLRAAVFNAYKLAYKDGNKNQLQGRNNSLYEQAKLFSDYAACRDAGMNKPKVAATYYAAHLSALELIGVPGKLADADADAVDSAATDAADRYLAQVQAFTDAIAADAAEKRAARKAAKDAEQGPVQAGNSDDASATVPTSAISAETSDVTTISIAAMVESIAEQITMGALTDAELAIIQNALALRAADVALATASAPVEFEVPA